MIVCFLGIGGIVDHRCLEVIVCFLGIGGIDDHHCLEVIVPFVDNGEIFYYHCLNFLKNKMLQAFTDSAYCNIHVYVVIH